MTWDKYYIGTSYYPEQWDPSRWEEDFRKMNELGLNTVRMGEFAWAFFETGPGEFHFEWMDKAIDLAAQYSISVLLCTPTAAVPPWLYKLHPDVLGGNEKGPYTYGGRKGYCTNSPDMLGAVERIVTAMAKHYGSNKNIIGWQLDNEPGYPFVCYDDHCVRAFRNWLKERYGSIERLNDAWGGAFWSNRYSDWDQVGFPVNSAEAGWFPGEKLDYRRFFSDSYINYLKKQANILREYTTNQFLYTNYPCTNWTLDTYKVADTCLDVSAFDNYIADPGINDYRLQLNSGKHHDLMRCAGPNGRFLIAEQSAQATACGYPEKVRLQTYIDFAHGASGTMFFEWRPPLGGSEQGYISMLQPDGSFGPAYEQYLKLTSELKRISPDLANAKTESDIAIIFCYENQWNQGFWIGPDGYDQEMSQYYKGLKTLHRNLDVISIKSDFSKYRLIAAPGLKIVSDSLADKLNKYVEDGGILILNFESGTKDVYNRIRESIGPGPFSESAGMTVPSRYRMRDSEGRRLPRPEGYNITFKNDNKAFIPGSYMEGIVTKSAENIAAFNGGQLTGKPGITVNSYGKGFVVYVGTNSDDVEFYERIGLVIRDRFKIKPILEVPKGVEVVSRVTDSSEYIFILNLTAEVKKIELTGTFEELISCREVHGSCTLEALDVVILKRERDKSSI